MEDWRGTEITVGCRVLYHSGSSAWESTWKIGHVTEIKHGALTVQWTESSWHEEKPRKGHGVLPVKVTVWPEEPANVFAVI